MAALDEIEDLEKQIHEKLKRITEIGTKLGKARENAEKLRAAIEAAQAKANHHTNNRRHMKNVADVVDLNEFAKTIKHRESAQETVQDSKALLASAENAIEAYTTEIVAAEAEVKKARAKLTKYGQIVPFPERSAA